MAAVNETVAVALIASLSTLVAAGLTGTVTAGLASRQLRHQRDLAGAERAAQRAAAHRELRRDAYERFLARADAAYRLLDEGWQAAPPATGPAPVAGFAARRALDEALIRVQLMGPEEVGRRGAELVASAGDEFRLHRRVVAADPGAAGSASELDRDARAEALAARARASQGFIGAARRALGGDDEAG
jgi:hypothetical protein